MKIRSLPLLLCLLCPSAAQRRFEILSAVYGSGVNTVDVTERVRGMISNDALSLTVDTPTLGVDPAPGTEKFLHIRYRFGGKEDLASAKDFDSVRLPKKSSFSISELGVNSGGAAVVTPAAPATPAPAISPAPAPSAAPVLRIVEASWGWENKVNDVRTRVEQQVRNNRASFKVTNDALGGDPAVGKNKTLTVTYEWQGATYKASQREDRSIDIPASGATLVRNAPAAAAVAPPASSAPAPGFENGRPANLRIFSARYVRADGQTDVRAKVAGLVSNDRASFAIDPGMLGVAGGGYLVVRYEFKGRTFERVASDGQTLTLP